MPFPFEIQFSSDLGGPLSEGSDDALDATLNAIKEIILKENYNSIYDIVVNENTLSFRVDLWSTGSAHFMQTIRRGTFALGKTPTAFRIAYKYNIGGLFIYFTVLTVIVMIAALLTSEISPRVILSNALLIYLAVSIVLWIGTLISQKLFFNRVVKFISRN